MPRSTPRRRNSLYSLFRLTLGSLFEGDYAARVTFGWIAIIFFSFFPAESEAATLRKVIAKKRQVILDVTEDEARLLTPGDSVRVKFYGDSNPRLAQVVKVSEGRATLKLSTPPKDLQSFTLDGAVTIVAMASEPDTKQTRKVDDVPAERAQQKIGERDLAAAPNLLSWTYVNPAQQASGNGTRIEAGVFYSLLTVRDSDSKFTYRSLTSEFGAVVAVTPVLHVGLLTLYQQGSSSSPFIDTADTKFTDMVAAPLVAAKFGILALGAQYIYENLTYTFTSQDSTENSSANDWGMFAIIGVEASLSHTKLGLSYRTRERQDPSPPAFIFNASKDLSILTIGTALTYQYNIDTDTGPGASSTSLDAKLFLTFPINHSADLKLLAAYIPHNFEGGLEALRVGFEGLFGAGFRAGAEYQLDLGAKNNLAIGLRYDSFGSKLGHELNGKAYIPSVRYTQQL